MAKQRLQMKVILSNFSHRLLILILIALLTIAIYKYVHFSIDLEQWRKVEEEVFGDDPEKLKWAREGGKL